MNLFPWRVICVSDFPTFVVRGFRRRNDAEDFAKLMRSQSQEFNYKVIYCHE
jgi:hypothetical protein